MDKLKLEDILKIRLSQTEAGEIDITPDTMTMKEIGVLLSREKGVPMSRPTIIKYVKNGIFERAGIRTIRLGKNVRFLRSDVIAMLGKTGRTL